MPVVVVAVLLGFISELEARLPATGVIKAPNFSLSTQTTEFTPTMSCPKGVNLAASVGRISSAIVGHAKAKQEARPAAEGQTALPTISQGVGGGAASIETIQTDSMILSMEMMGPKDIERPSRGNPKLTSSLNQLLEAYRKGGTVAAQAFAKKHNMVIEDDRVQVTVVTTEEAIDEIRAAVETAGGEYQLHYKNLVQALMPIGALEVLAQRPDVQIIREPRRATVQ